MTIVTVLPASGASFFDVRDGGRSLRVTWHPRDDMFQMSVAELYEIAVGVLHLQERRQLRLFVRKDLYGRFISCLVYLPRDRFTTANRLAIQGILLRELNGIGENLNEMTSPLYGADAFLGVVNVVDAVGGVRMCLPAPVHDTYSGAERMDFGPWKP